MKAALVVLAGALGSVVWGAVVDRAGRRSPGRKLAAMALLCIVALAGRPPSARRASASLCGQQPSSR